MKKVRVLFAYDLGGTLQDVQASLSILMSAYPTAAFDTFALRSFNLSYLSRHDPVISFEAEHVPVQFGSDRFMASRRCYVYPWLGVLHVELDFDFEQGKNSLSSLDFYDHLVAWKNEDYLPYLARSGAMNDSLQIATGFDPSRNRSHVGPLADMCESILLLLAKQINSRPERYPFHDFRMVLITDDSQKESPSTLSNLLDLASENSTPTKPQEFAHLETHVSGTHISSSGWVSALVLPRANGSDTEAQVALVIRLIHAQWFVCQAWVHILSKEIADEAVEFSQKHLYELARYRGRFDADFVEVGNIDLMLKDPRLIRVSSVIADAFNLSQHRDTAVTRFESVSIAESKRIEEQRTKEAQRLQLLFSISAAVAIAGLIPVLAQTETPLAVFTLIIVIVLGIGFTANVVLIFKRIFRARRKSVKKRRNRQFLAQAGG